MSARILVASAAFVAVACSTRSFDIGRNDPAPPTPASVTDASAVVSQYGCPTFFDAEMKALQGQTCNGACSAALGSPYALATQTEIVAATAGPWLFCEAAPFGPHDAIGIEFAPGCRIFFLRLDASGAPVRGTEAAYQASFDVYDLTAPGAPRRIDVELDATTKLTFDVRASACPNRVELVNTATGATIGLESDGFGDGGRPDGIK